MGHRERPRDLVGRLHALTLVPPEAPRFRGTSLFEKYVVGDTGIEPVTFPM